MADGNKGDANSLVIDFSSINLDVAESPKSEDSVPDVNAGSDSSSERFDTKDNAETQATGNQIELELGDIVGQKKPHASASTPALSPVPPVVKTGLSEAARQQSESSSSGMNLSDSEATVSFLNVSVPSHSDAVAAAGNASASNATGSNATGSNATGSNATGSNATGSNATGSNPSGSNPSGGNASASNVSADKNAAGNLAASKPDSSKLAANAAPASELGSKPLPQNQNAGKSPTQVQKVQLGKMGAMEPSRIESESFVEEKATPRKKLLLAVASFAAAAAGMIFYMDGFDIGAFMESPATPLAAKPINAPKKDASNKSEKAQAAKAPLAGATMSLSARDLSASKNASHFRDLDAVILAGDPYGAIQKFRASMPAPMTQLDKILASELEARYYLLVGTPKKAWEVLEPVCRADPQANATACVHYVRALVSSKRLREAQGFLAWTSEKASYSQFRGQLEMMRMAVSAFAAPRPESVHAFVDNVTTDMNMDAEWHRQRTQWLAAVVLSLGRLERYALMKFVLETKRDALVSVVKQADRLGMTSLDPILIPFLNSQSVLFELRNVGVVGKRSRWESDLSRAAAFLGLVEMATTESAETVSSVAQGFVGKPLFGELGKIVAANVAINEGNVQFAWGLYNQELGNIKARKSRFAYDWALVAARCVAAVGNPDAADVASKELRKYLIQYPVLRSDFHFWMLLSKLERMQRKYELRAFDWAKTLAATQQDEGLVVVEEARRLCDASRVPEAVKLIQSAIRKIPHHGVLLQAGAEILPRVGVEPKRILEAQTRIPSKYMNRNFEYPIMSDVAMKLMIEEM